MDTINQVNALLFPDGGDPMPSWAALFIAPVGLSCIKPSLFAYLTISPTVISPS